ncbi:MAG: ATP-binding protein, partial [Pleurocapsa sp. MO_226.B13]|nr:ATP-binding protein [Pleurocapsa sp. MO_226.B13]
MKKFKSAFAGREKEIEQLENLLINSQSDSDSRIAVISGIPGVGKSALAYRFASLHEDEFSGGVYVVRVDKFKGEGENNALKRLAEWFAEKSKGSFDQNDSREPRRIMEECFTNAKALLIFDNADLTDNDNINKNYIKKINELFPSKNCSIIVTMQANSVSTTNDWQIDKKIELKSFSEPESKELLETIFRDAQKRDAKIDDSLYKNRIDELNDPQNQEFLSKIFKTVGNLPLAVEIIGLTLTLSFYEYETLENYSHELNNNIDLTLRKDVEVDDEGVYAVFSLSLKALKPDCIYFFACLGACTSNNFSLSLISSLSDFGENAKNYLRVLTNRSLISRTSVEHYEMHNLIFRFAQDVFNKKYSLKPPLDIDIKRVEYNHAKYFVELVNQDYELPIPDEISIDYELPKHSNKKKLNYKYIIEELKFNYDDLISAAEWLAKPDNFNFDKDGISYRFILGKILENFFYQYREKEKFEELVDEFYKTAQKIKTNHEYCKKYFHLKILYSDYCSSKYKKPNKLENVKNEVKKASNLSQPEKDELDFMCLTKLFWAYARDLRKFDEAENYLEEVKKVFIRLQSSCDDKGTSFLSLFPEDINILSSRFYTLKAQERNFAPDTQEWLEKAKDFSS